MTIITPSGRTIEPVEVVTPEYLQAKIDSAAPTDIVSHAELEHSVSIASTAVDAKFDMLRVAIVESTDYETLKARLLAVLQ